MLFFSISYSTWCRMIVWGLCCLLFSSVLALAGQRLEPIDVQAELQKIDGYIQSSPNSEAQNNEVLNHSQPLKPRDLYRQYIAKTSQISQQLLRLKQESDTRKGGFSLQRLGALTQSLAAENANLNQQIRQGETALQSYQLIQKAITTLEDTVAYWRVSNRYRSLYRGTLQDKTDDDEILRVKLEAAFQAIEELKELEKVREALDKSLAD